jgi:hypothetical protein
MIAWQEELASASACESGRRDTVARAFYTHGNQIHLGYVRLTRYEPAKETLSAVVGEAVERLDAEAKYGKVELEHLAAISLQQYCGRRRHDNGESSAHSRLERIVNFVIVRAGSKPEAIESYGTPSQSGIGSATRESGMRGVQTLLHLSLCADDADFSDANRIIRTYPNIALGLEPYALLHTKPGTNQTLETIVRYDSLRDSS